MPKRNKINLSGGALDDDFGAEGDLYGVSSRRGAKGGGGGGKGGGGRKPPTREVTVSKKLSWVLRHGALQEGLKVDEGGFVNCAELVSWAFVLISVRCFWEVESLVCGGF